MKQIQLFITLLLLACAQYASATHNRGGEITFRQISGLTYEVTVITYTKLTNAADRPKLLVLWGDNTRDSVLRNAQTPIANDIGRNIYTSTHTFPGPSTYIISVEDPNRNGGVVNIPNSITVPFYIQTTLTINPFLGIDNSPVLLYPPIDMGCVNRLFVHNPGAYDPDGDSLSYEMVPCRGDQGLVIPGYTYPSASTFISVDPYTGDLTWDKPIQQGEYNVAILIKEWRNGVLIGSILRDMQIDITNCANRPPIINVPNDTCILAGTSLQKTITATDPDNFDRVTLTATSGIFSLPINPASFLQPVSGMNSVSSTFNWNTVCTHIRKEPYSVLFRAVDNGSPSLVALKTWRINVIGPPPINLNANSSRGTILLNWQYPICTNATGYKIYRKQGSSSWSPADCEIGVPASTGYELIDTVMGSNITSYLDDDNGNGLASGVQYCYRITAFFSTNPLLPLSGPESKASIEVCAIVKKDLPVMVQVDVEKTDAAQGIIGIRWAKPTQLDTNQFPGPYSYKLYRSENASFTNKTLVSVYSGNQLWQLQDTFYRDVNINTRKGWYYKLEFFYAGNSEVGKVRPASSHFLTINSVNSRLILNWKYQVNWQVDSVDIYRKNNGVFQWIARTTNPTTYTDKDLKNSIEYCYYIKSYGHFTSPGLPDSSINRSQELCDFPKDTVPPCNIQFSLDSNCVELKNTLTWSVDSTIDCFEDILLYRIYYAESSTAPFKLLDSVSRNARQYVYQNGRSISGCFSITGVDSSYNEGKTLFSICTSDCPLYELPNVFSPNSDGKNDLFIPFPYRGVDSIDLHIYNRWGVEVFSTNQPDINWNGIDKNSGQECAPSVYYYVGTAYYRSAFGQTPVPLKGLINLIR